MQKCDVDRLCGINEGEEKCLWCFCREHEGRNLLEELGTNGGIILKCFLMKCVEMALTEFILLG
jgi:hypothetical protein